MPASERNTTTHRKQAGKVSLEAEVEAERNPLRRLLRILGPGFISGAADDDPSGIGTYATAGASLGFATLWTALLTFPLMAAVQPRRFVSVLFVRLPMIFRLFAMSMIRTRRAVRQSR